MKIKILIFTWLTFSTGYLLLALLSFEVRYSWSLSPLVWFPAGLLQGVLCAITVRHWPLWLVTGFLLHLIASQLYNIPVNISLIFSILDVAFIVMTALVWHFIHGAMNSLEKIKSVFLLISLCTFIGVIERYLIKLTFFSLHYPVEPEISLTIINGYVLSYLPLTFFVIYVITYKHREKRGWRIYASTFLMLAMMILLFSTYPSGVKGLHWQDVFLLFSFAFPAILAFAGDVLILSFFLSVCCVGCVSATIFGYGPFYGSQVNLPLDVLSCAWYCAAFSLPTLIYSCWITQDLSGLTSKKIKIRLMSAALKERMYSTFRITDGGDILWYYQYIWSDNKLLPVKWMHFVAWLHPEDRVEVERLKDTVSTEPQSLVIRLLSIEGDYKRVAIMLLNDKDISSYGIEGILFPAAD